MSRRSTVDMTTGPFLKKLLIFALPLMLTDVLQLVYNSADVIVIGRFAGSTSLAAVGSTGSLINLILNLFIGLATGTGVVTAHYIGAGNERELRKSVHTAMCLSAFCGIFIGLFGFFFSKTFLIWMGTPDDVLPLAALYLKIYFLGAPASLVYNFGAAIVRANGDTKRPLFILSGTGLVNVLLNLLFVIKFNLDVAGVAIATITAQYISAVLIVIRLTHLDNACRLSIKELGINRDELRRIAKIGLPAGIQSSLFSVSNVLIQSTVNSFGPLAMAGNAAAANADSFLYTTMNAVAQTTMTFSSQNMGAKRYTNIKKIYTECIIITVITGVSLGALATVFAAPIISIFSKDSEVIAYGVDRLVIMASTYFTSGLMNVSGCQLRGMSRSVEPMVITLLGACGLRIAWIYLVFPFDPTLFNLYISYPITWTVTFLTLLICCFYHYKKLIRKQNSPLENAA